MPSFDCWRRTISAVALFTMLATVRPVTAAEPTGLQLGSADYVDYGLILGSLAMLGGSRLFDRPTAAKLGPVYDPKDPTAILDPAFAPRIGRAYAEEGSGELVPVSAATVGVGLVFAAVAADTMAHQWTGDRYGGRGSHDAIVGFAEGALLTLGITELLKPLVGRLRPDFQDRARRYHCFAPSGEAQLPATECQGVQPLSTDASEALHLLDDGRKSFPSGHSAMSMFAATYAFSYIGGRYIWGDAASDSSRAIGLLAGGFLLGTAGFVATSRFDDGRHNLTDIVAGAGLGVAFATFSYWRRFDARGRPRRALPQAAAAVDLSGRGLQVRFDF